MQNSESLERLREAFNDLNRQWEAAKVSPIFGPPSLDPVSGQIEVEVKACVCSFSLEAKIDSRAVRLRNRVQTLCPPPAPATNEGFLQSFVKRFSISAEDLSSDADDSNKGRRAIESAISRLSKSVQVP